LSFDLFVGCFRNGERSTFPRALIEEHFGPYVSAREPGCLTLSFGANCQSYLFVDDAADVDGFNINRPVSSTQLYDALLSVLRSDSLALYMPGNCPPLIGKIEVSAHLPHAMVASLGTPMVLSSSHEIPARIKEA
jgi:hypothetical protein